MRKEKRAALIRQQNLEDIEILIGFADKDASEIVALRQGNVQVEISAWLLREVSERLRHQANFMEPVVVATRADREKDGTHWAYGPTKVAYS